MRVFWVWAGLVGLWPVWTVAAAGPMPKAGPVRKVAPLRAKALATIPREDGRPVKEDRGRIESRIAAARGQAQKGQYSDAVIALTKTFAETQPSLDQQIAIYELLATCYVALGELELAVGSFTEVLRRRPDFALDPIRSSPKVRAALETAKSLF